MAFEKATREQNVLKMALSGVSGSGKTYTAIMFAYALLKHIGKEGGVVGVLDTEHGSAKKYLGNEVEDIRWNFLHSDMKYYRPDAYVHEVEKSAIEAGLDVLIIDSMSHEWVGVGGALEMVDNSASRNKFAAWRDVTPKHNEFIEAIMKVPIHTIATMRSKTEYVVDKDEKGKTTIEKVGLKPVQRENVEYEFDVMCELSIDHTLRVTKSRCSAVDGAVERNVTGDFVIPIVKWLLSGEKPKPVAPPTVDPKEALAQQAKTLFTALGTDIEKVKALLQRKGVKRLIDLGHNDLVKLVNKLNVQRTEKEAIETFQGEAGPY
jgi:hypothetical protein